MELSTESVWNRRRARGPTISLRAYNMTIGMVLGWGFFVNFMMISMIPAEAVLGINTWVFLIGYVACVFGGTYIYSTSDDPLVSFGGYNLIVVPLGLMLVRMLPFYDPAVISQAFLATGLITACMMVLSMLYPGFFLSIGRGLFVALMVAILVEVGMSIFTGTTPPIMDAVMVLIFSGYIGYDWARAQKLPKTLDNAVDSAAALYVDIVILFMRLLRMFSRR